MNYCNLALLYLIVKNNVYLCYLLLDVQTCCLLFAAAPEEWVLKNNLGSSQALTLLRKHPFGENASLISHSKTISAYSGRKNGTAPLHSSKVKSRSL